MAIPFIADNIILHRADCLLFLASLPDDSIDLIATDPPYYKVKKDAWDNQWQSQTEFLSWLDSVVSVNRKTF